MGDTGNRDIHVWASGNLYSTLDVRHPGVKLHCHGNTFTGAFNGTGIYNNGRNGFEIYDLTLRNVVGGYGIRCSGASDLSFVNVNVIDIDWIGIRIDSRSSSPWNHTIYNLYMRDCRFENTGSHGLETYGIDGINLEGTMTARNNGECGVLLNQTRNGTIDVVDAYNSAWGTGYAGLRYANACQNITTDQLYADRCGRGFFIVQSGPTVNCHVNYAEIGECSGLGIWIENGSNCSVKGGCTDSGVSVSGSGSYANVSNSCSSGGGNVYQFRNRSTGKFIDGMGRTTNGDAAGQWGNTTHPNSKWYVQDAGSGYSYLVNVGTGLKLDGYGRTNNGEACAQYDGSTTHPNAQWSFVDAGSGYVFIQNRGTGMRLDGYGYQTDGDDLMQYSGTTHPNAQWEMISTSARTTEESKPAEEIVQLTAQLNLFPNPVGPKQPFTITLPKTSEQMTMKVFDLGGKMILTQDYESVNEISVDKGLSTGVYMLHLIEGSSTETLKLIVK